MCISAILNWNFHCRLKIWYNKYAGYITPWLLTDVRNFNSADNFLLSFGKPSIVFLKLSHLFKSSLAFSTLCDSDFSGHSSSSCGLSAMLDNGLGTGDQLPGKKSPKIFIRLWKLPEIQTGFFIECKASFSGVTKGKFCGGSRVKRKQMQEK